MRSFVDKMIRFTVKETKNSKRFIYTRLMLNGYITQEEIIKRFQVSSKKVEAILSSMYFVQKLQKEESVVYIFKRSFLKQFEFKCLECKHAKSTIKIINGIRKKYIKCYVEEIECIGNLLRKSLAINTLLLSEGYKIVEDKLYLNRKGVKDEEIEIGKWLLKDFIKYIRREHNRIFGIVIKDQNIEIRNWFNQFYSKLMLVMGGGARAKYIFKYYIKNRYEKAKREGKTSMNYRWLYNVEDLTSLRETFPLLCTRTGCYCTYHKNNECSLENAGQNCSAFLIEKMKAKFM